MSSPRSLLPVPQGQALQDGWTVAAAPLEPLDFVINIAIAGGLAYLLQLVYVRCGKSLSNRTAFGSNFPLLAMTTMLIISVVKSSMALSLGLVGALSVVRFRAAIKEPEELAFLFLTIAIGLGLGANQRLITVLAFAIISGLLLLRSVRKRDQGDTDFCLTISSRGTQRTSLAEIVRIVTDCANALDLKRYDDNPEALEACFLAEFDNLEALERTKVELRKSDPDISISLLDNRGIF